MAKFNKKPRTGARKGPAQPRRTETESYGEQASDTPRKGKSGYKAKRSFTRNKTIRAKQSGPGQTEGGFAPRKRTGGFKSAGAGNSKGVRPKQHDTDGAFEPRKKSFGFKRAESSDNRSARPKPYRSDGDFEPRKKTAGFKRTEGSGNRSERPKKYGSDRDELPRKKSSGFKPAAGEKRFRHEEFEADERHAASRKSHEKKPFAKTKSSGPSAPKADGDGLIRLNKYLSNSGVASRREADMLIQSGAVKVNGAVVSQLGYKIKPGDKVTYGDQAVKNERKVYVLLNKPKDYITTADDPRGRKTVMQLVEGACRERIYPVGRLDRNTTGLLLFTNDGELTTRLTHPKFGIRKVYQVSLNKGLQSEDFQAITEGIELEDGLIKADDLAYVGEGKKEIGIEIHSGRNRIVRRIFEHLGYDVVKLDRVVFAGLTKKDLPRGKYRFLTPKEVSFLHMLG